MTSVDALDIIAEKRQRSTPIFDIRYSPDGRYLAVASKGVVDIYATETYERKITLEARASLFCPLLIRFAMLFVFIVMRTKSRAV